MAKELRFWDTGFHRNLFSKRGMLVVRISGEADPHGYMLAQLLVLSASRFRNSRLFISMGFGLYHPSIFDVGRFCVRASACPLPGDHLPEFGDLGHTKIDENSVFVVYCPKFSKRTLFRWIERWQNWGFLGTFLLYERPSSWFGNFEKPGPELEFDFEADVELRLRSESYLDIIDSGYLLDLKTKSLTSALFALPTRDSILDMLLSHCFLGSR